MRAATALAPLLQPAVPLQLPGPPQIWRAGELRHDATGCVATGFDALNRELPGGGWPQGQLIELLLDDSGIGELSLLVPALARMTAERRACVWVLPCSFATAGAARPRGGLPASLPYAPALQDAGVDLAHSIFVKPETPRESLWACEQSLRAAHLGALIGWLPSHGSSADADFRALRRLHLLAARHRGLAFVLRPVRAAQSPSPAALRLQLAHDERALHVTLLKRRGRPLLDPIVLDLHPAHWSAARVPLQATPPQPAAPAQPTPIRTALTQAALTAQRWSMKAIFSH